MTTLQPPIRPQATFPWSAATLSAQQVRGLLRSQFPPLAALPIRRIGQGWDNTAWSVGPWIFRFPQRAETAALLARELRWLPVLAPQLPVPVPSPCFAGRPSEGFPWPFMGYRRLPGAPSAQVGLSVPVATSLGGFLRRLHALPVPAEAPADDRRRSHPERVFAALRARLGAGEAEILAHADALRAAEPPSGPPCWVHADLGGRHLLLDGQGRLGAILDWGDLHAGDRAVDLAVASGLFAGEARARFWAAYGDVDEDTRQRARLRALYVGVVVAQLGRGLGDVVLERAGMQGVERVLRG